MSKGKKGANWLRELSIEDVLRLLNSFFRRAAIDVTIVDFYLAREEVVIGFAGQIESFENELRDIKGEELARQGGRYIAEVRLVSGGREVTNIVRFYKKIDGSLSIEDTCNVAITLNEEEEINRPRQWEKVAKFGQTISETIVKSVIEMLVRSLMGSS